MKDYTPLFMISGFAIIVAVSWYIKTYNSFIKYKNRIEETWSGIDVALKRRFNLIPNLINAVRGYQAHEAEIMSKTIRDLTSSSPDLPHREQEESRISKSLHGLLALAEAYPDLKASNNFLALQENLDEIEEDIQEARNRFNRAVRQYNTLVESFPSSWIAGKYGFEKTNYFTLELATQREVPHVDLSRNGMKQA